jgi:hypothetical protein
MKKKRSHVKSRNPVAKAVRGLRPKVVPSKKRYMRKKLKEDE